MSVYFIAQVDVQDADGYQAYQEAAAKAPMHGAKLLALDGEPEIVEGSWDGPKTVILEFDSEEKFRTWYESPEYQAAAKMRQTATRSNPPQLVKQPVEKFLVVIHFQLAPGGNGIPVFNHVRHP